MTNRLKSLYYIPISEAYREGSCCSLMSHIQQDGNVIYTGAV